MSARKSAQGHHLECSILFSGLSTPMEMKLKLIPILQQMHHDIGMVSQVRPGNCTVIIKACYMSVCVCVCVCVCMCMCVCVCAICVPYSVSAMCGCHVWV